MSEMQQSKAVPGPPVGDEEPRDLMAEIAANNAADDRMRRGDDCVCELPPSKLSMGQLVQGLRLNVANVSGEAKSGRAVAPAVIALACDWMQEDLTALAAKAEAHDAMLAALAQAYAAIDAINPHDEAVGALNRAGLATGLVNAQRAIFAAIARAEGR